MSEQGIVIPVKEFSDPEGWIDGNKKWIKKYPFSTWTHPLFTDTTITPVIGQKMVDNFHQKVFGDKDLVVDYDHGKDPAKGGKAAGWIRDMELRADGVYELVEFTDVAKKEILDGEWRYYSGSHFDTWTHPQRNVTYEFVPNGGGLTNKPYVRDGILPLNFSDVFVERNDPNVAVSSEVDMPDVTDEHAGQEHADPGEEERLDERNDDDAADSGSRRDTPPVEPEDSVDTQLRTLLGLDPDADIVKAVSDMNAEVTPLREAAKAHSEAKAFNEMYPEQAKKLELLEARDKETRAKEFSESFKTLLDTDGNPTDHAFPAVVTDKLAEVHKRFSDGVGGINDLTEVIELIGKTGFVPMGEKGSSGTGDTYEQQNADPAKAFSEKVLEIKENDKVDHATAISLAAERHPALFAGYRSSLPGRSR